MLYRADGKSVTILSVPMQLATIALYAVDPITSVPLGIDQARALSMTNVTDHNNIDAFGMDKSDLTSLSIYLQEKSEQSMHIPVQSASDS